MFGNNSSSTTRDQHVFENIWGHTSELPPSLPISTIDQISPLSSPPLGIWIHSPQYTAKHVKDPQQSFPQQSFPQQSFPQESFPQHMSSQPSHSSNSPSVGQANISRHLPFNNSSDIPLECFPDSLTYPEYSSMGLTQSPSGNQYFMPIIHEATEDKFGSGWFHSHQDDTTSDKETSPDAEYLDEAEQEFVKIAPMLKDLTSKNMWVFLVHALSGIHQHIPLDDFFDLLYKEKPQGVLSEGTHKRQSRGLPRTVSLKLQGLKLCHLIIQTFENPKTTVGLHQNVFIRNSLISSTNMHELLRSFLAIKIIYSCVMKVSEFQSYPSSVPRISVYKLYYILCQLLMKKNTGYL
ncbi:hypothetical protein JCM33374_g5199 [Metschnikowia sp. JCM 33374]|nr:hypothetical protein JCM33374_g5199 [Metschnikowia sp. JCM 33374]